MIPKLGNTVYGLDGSTYKLAQEIGKGGEGSVWSLHGYPGLLAKFRHKGFTPEITAKLEAMCRMRTEALAGVSAWPLTLLKESRSAMPQALLMRRVSGAGINQLYSIKSRLKVFPEAQFPFLLHAAINVARAFATVHAANVVVGDVNHSNLWVSQNSTVAMIDCDSFQITEGSRTFLCEAGVPEFTPPELQGITFATRPRTMQHDAFGLSVLIFYLLFLGRHPFQGLYDPLTNDLVMEPEAIAKYKFPYALDATSPEVRLPAFVPKLQDYPTAIQALFKRAFTRESTGGKRPSATEWAEALLKLSTLLRSCANNPAHEYFAGLSKCPWCKTEGLIGSAIFGIRLTVTQEGNFNLQVIWAQIVSIAAVAEPLEIHAVNSLTPRMLPSSEAAQARVYRLRFRLIIAGLTLICSLSAVITLQPFFAIVTLAALLAFAATMWQRAALRDQPFKGELSRAQSAWTAAVSAFKESEQSPRALVEEREKLEKFASELESLPGQKAGRLGKLEADRRQKQLQHHLERFQIDDAQIPSLGPKLKMLLKLNNIEDAWDVTADRITNIKGFGPVKRDILLTWRRDKERLFAFNPNSPVDPRDLLALEQEFQEKARLLRSKLNAGPDVLRQVVSIWRAQQRLRANSLNAATEQLARAVVNRDALKVRGLPLQIL